MLVDPKLHPRRFVAGRFQDVEQDIALVAQHVARKANAVRLRNGKRNVDTAFVNGGSQGGLAGLEEPRREVVAAATQSRL
jgi:hypothetical protein